MKNVSGNANWFDSHKSEQSDEQKQRSLSEQEVTDFSNAYLELLAQSQKLYEDKPLKILHDIKIVLGSIKEDMKELVILAKNNNPN
mgnify:FL=1